MHARLPAGSQRARTTAAVLLAAVLERADEQVLPSVYAAVARSLAASPSVLGLITLSRSLAQALASPLGGGAGHAARRDRVVAAGCLLWSACAAAFAAASSTAAAMSAWVLGGVGLALIVPSCQSLLADLHAARARGRAFGGMHLAASAGGIGRGAGRHKSRGAQGVGRGGLARRIPRYGRCLGGGGRRRAGAGARPALPARPGGGR
jgi:MFS family permease